MKRKQALELSARGARYRSVVTVSVIVIAVLLLLEYFGSYLVRPANGRAVLVSLIVLAPQAVYLYGLWSLRRAFDEIAQGRFFAEAATEALSHLGIALIIGATYSVVLLTNFVRLMLHTRGSFLNFDLSDIVLGFVGAGLLILARLLAQSRAMQAELDEMV